MVLKEKEDLDLQYFPFYYRKFMDGVRGETIEFIGTYMMMLCRQAEKKRIDPDLKKLIRWMGEANIETINEVLRAKFKRDEEGWYNEVLENVLIKVEMKVEDRRKRAKLAAGKRWKQSGYEDVEQKNEPQKPDADAMHKHTMGIANALPEHSMSTADAMPMQSMGNPNKSKVNKSKVNKSKVNKSKVDVVVEGGQPQPPPSKVEFENYCSSVNLTPEETARIWSYYQASRNIESNAPEAWRKKDGSIIKNWKQHIASVWLKDRKTANGNQSTTSKNVAGWRDTTSA